MLGRKKTADGRVMVRMHVDARDRVQALASELGISGVNVWRALSFASADEYSRLERRRVEALRKAAGDGNATD